MTTNEKNRMMAESNKLIADFMGYPKEGEKSPYYYAMKHCYENDNMKYHTSWDWLMPVWNKILNIGRTECSLGVGGLPNDFTYNYNRLIRNAENELCRGEIEPFYKAVLHFIQWYTTQQKEAGDE